MTKQSNVIERNREELVSLKVIAEGIITSDVFAEEPEHIQDKFESVYVQIQELLLQQEEMDDQQFKSVISSMKMTLREVMEDIASSSNIELNIQANGSIVIKEKEVHIH